MLQVIAGLKAAQQYKEAEQQVDQALEGQLGLRASLVKELDDERLKEMLTTGGRLELERFLLVADLFRELAELAQRRGDELAFRRDGGRALRFYRQGLGDGGEAVDEKLPEKIADAGRTVRQRKFSSIDRQPCDCRGGQARHQEENSLEKPGFRPRAAFLAIEASRMRQKPYQLELIVFLAILLVGCQTQRTSLPAATNEPVHALVTIPPVISSATKLAPSPLPAKSNIPTRGESGRLHPYSLPSEDSNCHGYTYTCS